nr:glutamic acid-rich protein-like [Ipomoea batatas]
MNRTAEGQWVAYVPYVEESGERFHGCNIPLYMKRRSNLQRQNFQRHRNKAIQKENKRKEEGNRELKRQREKDLARSREIRAKVADITRIQRDKERQVKYKVVFVIMVDAEQSFIERMNTTKFLLWWNRGIVEGSNILGAFNNYMRFKVTTKYADLIKDKSIHESRQAINDILMAGTCVNVEDFYKLCIR